MLYQMFRSLAKVIIVKLMGGLGNQMFQYAAARRLALRHDTELALDCSYLGNPESLDTPRRYELSKLSIRARKASALEIAEFSGTSRTFWQRSLIALRHYRGIAHRATPVYETQMGFNPEVLNLPDNVYLSGYWQSERYFADIADTILNELSPAEEIAEEDLTLSKQMKSGTSVAVHFRRGDYVENPRTAAFHGVLPLAYYEQALQHIAGALTEPKLYIFSDDPGWVRSSIKFPFPAYIMNNESRRSPCEDMRLMSLCSHAIIANSSFSWWGAWMIRNTDKIVIAPKRWVLNTRVKIRDLLPESWIKI